VVAVVDPEVVVLGGLIASAGDLMIEPSRAEAVRRMSPRTVPRIVAAAPGEDATAIGAARAAMLQP
jgi:glucokinase